MRRLDNKKTTHRTRYNFSQSCHFFQDSLHGVTKKHKKEKDKDEKCVTNLPNTYGLFKYLSLNLPGHSKIRFDHL